MGENKGYKEGSRPYPYGSFMGTQVIKNPDSEEHIAKYTCPAFASRLVWQTGMAQVGIDRDAG